ncbi:MAG: response regulator receiver/unknown domain-containing protein [Osedax symbiont Rs2]|nr:MAG: response regulator receiver/unknown domain-containing protein [Osedax symbiont Rs1]EPJ55488.1 MAG: response regulator receiver/unknown domain-containing protein [Osedax symbiont Rs2]
MSNISIVIAEDDHKIAEIQRRFIERIDGFEILGIAHTTIDAQDMIEVLEPDLLLLDIHFPEGNGLELLREIRRSKSTSDVILITAAKDVNSLTEALHSGVFDYILKPLVFDRLQTALHNFRDHSNKLQALENQSKKGLDQSTVDQLLPRNLLSQKNILNSNLPKGIDPLTLEKIRSIFSSSTSGHTAEQMGELVGSSRTTARRYLEYLVSNSELIADVSYGSVGRPERLYLRTSLND